MGNKNSRVNLSRGHPPVQLQLSVTGGLAGRAAPAAAASSPNGPPPASAGDRSGLPRVISIDHSKVNLITESNPFECSVCLNLYNDTENLPTTFPCGHTVCLVHVHQLQRCPFCRAAIPPPAQCHPTLVLRDAAMLFAQITAEAFGRSQSGDADDDDDGAGTMVRESSWEMVEQQIERHQEAVSHSDRLRLEREQQVAADEAFARRLVQDEQREADRARDRDNRIRFFTFNNNNGGGGGSARPQPLPLEAPRPGHDARQLIAAYAAPEQAQQPAAAGTANRPITLSGGPPQPAAGTQPCTRCQKQCFLPARLGRCCACLDKRPVQPEGTYPAYVDGAGWVETGRRNAGYCPLCSRH